MLLPLISFSLLLPFCQTTFELAEAAHLSTEKTMLDGTSGNQVAAAHPAMSGRAGWASWFDGCSARSWKSCPGRQESGIGHICCKKLIQVPAQFPLLLMFKWCCFQIIFLMESWRSGGTPAALFELRLAPAECWTLAWLRDMGKRKHICNIWNISLHLVVVIRTCLHQLPCYVHSSALECLLVA